MGLLTKKYLSRCTHSIASFEHQKLLEVSSKKVFEVNHVSLTKGEVTVSKTYYFVQYNGTLDQSVWGFKRLALKLS